jgi:hypothetical protein
MRALMSVLIVATGLFAQQPAAKSFTSAADVAAMMAKAKSERKSDQANFIDVLLRSAPYTVNLSTACEASILHRACTKRR